MQSFKYNKYAIKNENECNCIIKDRLSWKNDEWIV